MIIAQKYRVLHHTPCPHNEHVKGIVAGGELVSLPVVLMDSMSDQCYLLRYYGTDKEIITGVLSKHNGMK